MIRFEIKKNGFVFLVFVVALLCSVANIFFTSSNYGAYRESLKTLSDVARASGDTVITENFKRKYYELIIVPELKQIQKESGIMISTFTGIFNETFDFDNFRILNDVIDRKITSYDFFSEEDDVKDFATRVLEILSEYYKGIFIQTGKTYFPENRLTKFADGFAFLKGVVFLECFIMSVLAFVFCSFNEKHSRQEMFEMFFATRRGKKIYYIKILEAMVLSFACMVIVVLNTSIFHFLYFDYSPFVYTSIDGPFFFDDYASVQLVIPGLSFLHYYFLNLVIMMLSLMIVWFLLSIAFVVSQSDPVWVLIMASALIALFILSTIITKRSDTFITTVFPFPLFFIGNRILLKDSSDRLLFNKGNLSMVFAFSYWLATGVLMNICLFRTRLKGNER